ncbi:hypothetical protein [Nonomuraea indica]|uniref:hypothetical protein n=1 Tax=Nonomuraea indica TaxID=1581193 RepID=UPI0015DF4BF9|nr:hypothetical protein [Nonomuraea indica]
MRVGDFPHARMWTNKTLDYAMELGDQRTISYILMRKSLIPIESGDHGHGLGLANAAMSRADALTPRLRAVVLRTRAIAHAHLGEAADSAADSETALTEATEGLTQDENDCAPYCTPAYIAMETGATRLLLGQANSAIPVFESSRSLWSLTSQALDHALLLARTATAYAMAGERDQACSVIEETIPRLQALRSSRVAGQLTTLRAHMRRWAADPGVKDLLSQALLNCSHRDQAAARRAAVPRPSLAPALRVPTATRRPRRLRSYRTLTARAARLDRDRRRNR